MPKKCYTNEENFPLGFGDTVGERDTLFCSSNL